MKAIRPAARLGTVLAGAIAIGACSYSADSNKIPAAASVAEAAPQYTNPTTMQDMMTATPLTIDNYRPQRSLASCGVRELPSGEADAKLAVALEQARTYSEEQQGAGLVVVKDGKIIHESYALGADKDSKFATASMMKSVLGLTFGIALEKGLVGSVDDTVGMYLPEWKGEPRGEITLQELLTMSSGLAPQPFQTFLLSPDSYATVLDMQLATEPGSTFYYNNSVSQLIGLILDRQARKNGYEDYTDFLQRELWCPLGNSQAILWVDMQGTPRSYAGLHTNLRDWARIGELIRNDGQAGGKQVVPSSWIAAMAEPSATNSQYGYQQWRAGEWTAQRAYNPDNPVKIVHSEPFLADDLVYFDGFGGQRVYVIPSKGLTIVRVGLVSMTFDDAKIPNTILRGIE